MRHFKYVVLLVLLWGCTFSATYIDRKEDIDKARVVSSAFYKLLAAHKSDSIFSYCSSAIKMNDQERKKMQFILEQSVLRFGEMKEASLIQAKSKVQVGKRAFQEYRFTYKVIRDKYTTLENFILADEDNNIRVFTYGVEKFQ